MSKLATKIDILHRSGKTVFATDELAAFWGIEDKQILYVNISRMKKAGFLKTIQRGLYAITNTEINHFELAINLKKNSYISFETMLSKEEIIHQWYGTYFSASDRKLDLKNKYGKFSFRRLPEEILNNKLGIKNEKNYFIATAERAICDYFYIAGFQQLDNLSDINKDKLLEIAKIYHNQRLEKDINKLIKQL